MTDYSCVRKLSTKARGLYLLSLMENMQIPVFSSLKVTEAKLIEQALDTVEMRIISGSSLVSIRNKEMDQYEVLDFFARSLQNTISKHSVESFRVADVHNAKLCFLENSPFLKNIAASGFSDLLCECSQKVLKACMPAINILHTVWPEIYQDLLSSADIYVGIVGSSGEIGSGTTTDAPGIVFIAINNPPVLICEQIIHEGTHSQLNLAFEQNTETQETLDIFPACYSPFTSSIRSAKRVFHGVMSYGRVLEFYKKLDDRCFNNKWFSGLGEKEGREAIKNRINQISLRVTKGWQALCSAAKYDEVIMLENIYRSFIGSPPPSILNYSSLKEVKEILGPVQYAETLLAQHGAKVSRFGISISSKKALETISRMDVSCCFSTFAYLPKPDPDLGGFPNEFNSTCNILSATKDHSVLCYVASNTESLRNAWSQDKSNRAGSMFGIPECCQLAFEEKWSRAVDQYNGEMFSMLLSSSKPEDYNIIRIPWENNLPTMYRRSGLCWHFPCRLDCTETIKVVNKRVDFLFKRDESLAKALISKQRQSFIWIPGVGYGFLPQEPLKEINMEDIEWLNMAAFHKPPSGPVLDWAKNSCNRNFRIGLVS